MANPWAGEVRLTLDGKARELRLTLGALAELEGELTGETVLDLIERFEAGRFSTRDVLTLIVAGLRGGGWRGVAGDLVSADIEGGLLECTKVAAQLLARAFTTQGT
ncbi:gene transfer agent family protein [Litoreibacter albidus]|uniref:Phage tail tube protein, GTA-gp10 n=1 Tax=Litoreibacter albidus TaxID=670155 RepID=A0A1H2SP77_9RHOB|nr:gene transfer agent family protein [Litoreibacter albidus]SDW33463.1 Phage tail tube protein, GTA-gp10 [Litoreibacter albidus]